MKKTFSAIAMVAALMNAPIALTGAMFMVTNTADTGPGSFRHAITNANATIELDRIEFQIPGAGPYTIAPLSALPQIFWPVVIDGTTQPGYAGQPIVELNGASAGTANGLSVLGQCTIRGLVINRFSASGIHLAGIYGTNVVEGNFIGTDRSGMFASPNQQFGILALSPANVIGGTNATSGNVISGNALAGIDIEGPNAISNRVQGNYIGLAVNGAGVLGNGKGIDVFNAANNIIGGSQPGAGNVISANTQSGIVIQQSASVGNVIEGNLIGTDSSGAFDLGNSAHGILLSGGRGNVIGGTSNGNRNVISGNNSSGIAIDVASHDNRIQGNVIGLNAAGTAKLANSQDGVLVSGSTNNLIGGTVAGAGNAISGNGFSGVELAGSGATNNKVEGNFIGTDPAGTNILGNAQAGVFINGARNNLVGGTIPGARNIISGNGILGIQISGAGASGNQIQGNLIGTDVTGTLDLGNAQAGINIFAVANNIVGGTSAGARNVISGNGLSGIIIEGAAAVGNRIQGNFVGTDITGTLDLGNDEDGVFITGGVNNVVGGTTPGAGNLLSGNGLSGMEIWNSASGNLVQGNLVGTDVSGTANLGNIEYGIYLQNSSRNTIGGTAVGAGNTIAFNQFDGVFVESGTNNLIRANSVLSNGGLGIDLGPNGVTPNDTCDLDVGANNLQNHPVLMAALANNDGSTTISGSLHSRANANFILEFFSNTACDASANGEGQTVIGVANITTATTCSNTFTITFTNTIPAGRFITATATDASTNTSEFSACVQVSNAVVSADLALALNDSPDPVTVGSRLGYLITVTNNSPTPASGVMVTVNLPGNVAFVSADSSPGNCMQANNVVTCAMGNLTNGFIATVSIRVTPLTAGNISTTANVTASTTDPLMPNNSASVTTAVLPPPQISAERSGNNLIVNWPAMTEEGFVVQCATNLSPPISWSAATNEVMEVNGQKKVILTISDRNRFYRLAKE